jgi:hypothetical protein
MPRDAYHFAANKKLRGPFGGPLMVAVQFNYFFFFAAFFAFFLVAIFSILPFHLFDGE